MISLTLSPCPQLGNNNNTRAPQNLEQILAEKMAEGYQLAAA